MNTLMKNVLFLIFINFALIACSKVTPSNMEAGNSDGADDGPVPSDQWVLIWSDEFDGTSLDEEKWEIQLGDGKAYGFTDNVKGWGNAEEQYYTNLPDNLRVENGSLVIASRADNPTPDSQYGYDASYGFSSAKVTTRGKFEFTYGRAEARIKMDSDNGLWHAFWLLGSDASPYGGWPQKGEIDIMEAWLIDDGHTSGTAHFGMQYYSSGAGFQSRHKFKGGEFTTSKLWDENADGETSLDNPYTEIPFNYNDGEYHVYAVEWDAKEIRWFVDGQHYFTLTQASYWNFYKDAENGWQGFIDKNSDEIDDNVDANRLAEFQDATANAPFDQDQYIILNTAVNGDLGCAQGCADPFGQVDIGEMYVDYVRVYQCPADDQLPEGRGCMKYLGSESHKPYYSNPAYRPDVLPETTSFVAVNDLYLDGPGPEDIIDTQISFIVDDGMQVQEENGYLKLTALRPANVSSINDLPALTLVKFDKNSQRGDFIMAGFDSAAKAMGDFKFDIYVESLSEFKVLAVGMAAGYDGQKTSKYSLITLDEDMVGKWQRMTVPIDEIVGGSGNGLLDTKRLSELLFFRFVGDTVARIDNLQFACGSLACGLVEDVPVFLDEVADLWTRGIRGNDSEQSALENADYDEGDENHVQWAFIDTSSEVHNDGKDHAIVVQTTIGEERAIPGESSYPNQAVNFVGSENALSVIAALSDGEFRFDIRMLNNPNNNDLYFKVDGGNYAGNCQSGIPCTTTGEQPLGDFETGQWRSFHCSIETLKLQGLGVDTITAPFVMVPGISGTGKDMSFQWDNVIFSPVKECKIENGECLLDDAGNEVTYDRFLTFPMSFPPEEGGFCLPVKPLAGGSFNLVGNAAPQMGHSDIKVPKHTKINYGEIWGGIVLKTPQDKPISFGPSNDQTGKRFILKALTPRNPLADYVDDNGTRPLGDMTVTFTLDRVPTSERVERTFTLNSQNDWEDIILDFSGEIERDYTGIILTIDSGILSDDNQANWTLYFDELDQIDSPYVLPDLLDINGSPALYDFDQTATYYYPDPFAACGARAEVVQDPEGTRGLVAKVVYDVIIPSCGSKGTTMMGSQGGLPNPIPFEANRTTISVDVYTANANAEVLLKVEDAQDSGRFAEITQTKTGAGWTTMTFDFADQGIEVNESFEKLLFIFEPDVCVYNQEFDPICTNQPASAEYFFDNIKLLP